MLTNTHLWVVPKYLKVIIPKLDVAVSEFVPGHMILLAAVEVVWW